MGEFAPFEDSWELFKLYPHTIEEGAIAPFAQNRILQLLIEFNRDRYRMGGPDFMHEWNLEKDFIPDTFSWDWKSPQGKLTSRLKSLYRELYNTGLPKNLVSEIGNIASQFATGDTETIELMFVNYLNWDRGDFADDNSCFWSYNDVVRVEFEKNPDLYAVQFFRGGDTGFARALLYIHKGVLYIFNSYGLMTPYVSSLLRDFLGTTDTDYYAYSPKTYFHFDDSPRSKLWINNFGHGAVIHTHGFLPVRDLYTVYIRENIGPNFTCTSCGEEFRGEPEYSTWDRSYCANCVEEYIRPCLGCNTEMDTERDEMFWEEDGCLCANCYETRENTIECEVCGRGIDQRHESYETEVTEEGEVQTLQVCRRCLRSHEVSPSTESPGIRITGSLDLEPLTNVPSGVFGSGIWAEIDLSAAFAEPLDGVSQVLYGGPPIAVPRRETIKVEDFIVNGVFYPIPYGRWTANFNEENFSHVSFREEHTSVTVHFTSNSATVNFLPDGICIDTTTEYLPNA